MTLLYLDALVGEQHMLGPKLRAIRAKVGLLERGFTAERRAELKENIPIWHGISSVLISKARPSVYAMWGFGRLGYVILPSVAFLSVLSLDATSHVPRVSRALRGAHRGSEDILGCT